MTSTQRVYFVGPGGPSKRETERSENQVTIEKLLNPVGCRYTRKQMRFIKRKARKHRGSIPLALRKIVDEAEAKEKADKKNKKGER